MSDFQLTKGQQEGYKKFADFYLDPMESVFLIKGFPGTGKSTLIKYLIQQLDKLNATMRLIDPAFVPYDVKLTATTNPAAEALAISTGINDTKTVHSLLGLRLFRDFKTGKTKLMISDGFPKAYRCLIVVDEASYLDQYTLGLIFEQIDDCKIVFVGDPDQLKPVTSSYMPAFNMDKNQIELTEMVRQGNNSPLTPVIEGFREAVRKGVFPKIKLAPGILEHVDQDTFETVAYKVFSKPDGPSSKILTYTNDRAIYYNNRMSEWITGTTEPQVGQRMFVNDAVHNNTERLNNNQEVMLEGVVMATRYGIAGYDIRLRGKYKDYFLPTSRTAKKSLIKNLIEDGEYQTAQEVEGSWVDLRPAFSSTVNKAQGSTYHTIFLDINDIAHRNHTADAIARLMYVGCSRASHRLMLTGDFG